jgi:hypothetical protein
MSSGIKIMNKQEYLALDLDFMVKFLRVCSDPKHPVYQRNQEQNRNSEFVKGLGCTNITR